MYGVIIKESKGNFIPYTINHFPKSKHNRLKKAILEDRLFTKAGNGEITSDEFLTALGYADPQFHMRDYIENHLTLDEAFYTFAESRKEMYHYALLSNDVSDWSKHITKFYKLDAYLPSKIISADVHCRKPEERIYEIALDFLGVSGEKCIFIDNSVENLLSARKFGMDTILFNRDSVACDGKTVDSFDDLLQIL